MDQSAAEWILQSPSRATVLAALTQPLTATQLSRRTDIDRNRCAKILNRTLLLQLTRCLNGKARRSRVLWVTRSGKECRDWIRALLGLSEAPPLQRNVDWRLYGWLCFTHRSAVVTALDRPMRPAEIKHRARFLDSDVRISASNVRDIVRLLLPRDIVEPDRIRRRARPRYQLTAKGWQFRELLMRAESEYIPCSLAERRLRQTDGAAAPAL